MDTLKEYEQDVTVFMRSYQSHSACNIWRVGQQSS